MPLTVMPMAQLKKYIGDEKISEWIEVTPEGSDKQALIAEWTSLVI